MLVTLDIDEDEVSFFIKLAKRLPFVNEITSTESGLAGIPDWQEQILKERLMDIENTNFTDTDEFISSLKN